MPIEFSWPLFHQAPVVGIIRGLSADVVRRILPVYHEAGLTTIEITMNTAGAETMIRNALEQYAGRLNIGAGTVCTEADLDRALNAGAQFIVTPILDETVVRASVARGVPIMPGAFTPTEIYRAWTAGASMVKVYPATSLGAAYIRDVKAPLDPIKLLPTGGISQHNMRDFFDAGANGVGVGSQLFDKALIRAEDWSGLREHFAQFMRGVPIRQA